MQLVINVFLSVAALLCVVAVGSYFDVTVLLSLSICCLVDVLQTDFSSILCNILRVARRAKVPCCGAGPQLFVLLKHHTGWISKDGRWRDSVHTYNS